VDWLLLEASTMQRKTASDFDQALLILFDTYAAVEAILCDLAVLARSQRHGCLLRRTRLRPFIATAAVFA
jgi:hypothetical protein